MNYKQRDDELIKLNKQAQAKADTAVRQGIAKQNKVYSLGALQKLASGNYRQNKANTVPSVKATKPSTRYNNQNVLKTPRTSTRDTKFDKDLGELWNYRFGDFSGEVDYDPVMDIEQPHWQTLREQIKRKNKWTDDELDTRFKAYDDERLGKMADEEISGAVELAKKHPIAGTLLQALYTPQNMIEGGAAMLSNLAPDKYKAQSADDTLFTGTRAKEGIKQTVKDEHIKSGLGKGAYDIGTSVGDMLMSAGIPILGTASLGAQAAARSNMQALERGVDPKKAAATGAASGVISGVMNKVGLDKALGKTGKTAVDAIKKAALTEGLENVTEDTANLAIDSLLNRDKSQLNTLHDYYVSQGMDDNAAWVQVAKDTGVDLGTSALSGAAFGGAMSGLKNLPALRGLLGNKTETGIPEVDSAIKQTNDATAKIQELSEQIPKTENADSISSIANQLTDDLTIAKKQAENNQFGVKHLDELKENDARVSLDKRGKLTKVLEENPHIKRNIEGVRKTPEIINTEINNLRSQIDNYQHGLMKENESFDCGETPAVLKESGVKGNRIMADQSIFDKITIPEGFVKNKKGVHYHGLDKDGFEKIIIGLNDPAVTLKLKNRKGEDAVNAIINYTSKNGHPVLVAVTLGEDGTISNISDIAGASKVMTAHIRGGLDNYIESNAKNIKYIKGDDGSDSNALWFDALKSSSPFDNNVTPTGENVNKVMNESAPRNPRLVQKLEGEERVQAETKKKQNDKDIRSINRVVKTIDDSLKTATGKRKAELEAQKKENLDRKTALQAENKELKRSLEGGTIPIEKYLKDTNSELHKELYGRKTGFFDNLNYVGKHAGDTPEAKQLVKDIKKSIEAFIETGDINSTIYSPETISKINKLDDLANTVDKEYIGHFSDNAIFSGKDGKASIWNALEGTDEKGGLLNKLGRYYDENLRVNDATSAPTNIPPEYDLATRYAQLYRDFDAYDYDDTTFQGDDGVDRMADDIAKGRDLTPYISALENMIEEAPDADTEAKMQSLLSELQSINEGRVNMTSGNGGNVPPNTPPDEPPVNNVPPIITEPTVDEGNYGQSRVVNHSAINADIITKKMLDNDPVLQDIAKYEKHSNAKTFENAMSNVKERGSELLDEYITDRRKIDNDQDVDTAMILLRDLSQQLKDGADVETQRNLLLSRLRKAGTERGQFIQAFAKWNDTADGALINGQRLLQKPTDTWISNNKQQVKKNKAISQRLINALSKDDGTISGRVKEPPTYSEIIRQVQNTLDREMSSVNDFTESDYRYIAGLIQDGATANELADAMNTRFATGKFDISPETQQKVNSLFEYANKYDPNSKKACEAKAEAYKLIAEETVMNASPLEKYETWRYLAMLGNPKTMIRNVVGNKMFGAITGVSNNLSAMLEAGTDKLSKALGGNGIQRTKAFLNPSSDSGLIKAAGNDAEAHRYSQLSGTKYEKGTRDAISRQKSVFNNKLIQLYEKITDAGISDYKAVKKKYSTSLAGYMKANGLDESAFDIDDQYRALKEASRTRLLSDAEKAKMESLKDTADTLEKARDYAVKQAEYATFHEDNSIAKLLTEFSQKARNSDKAGARSLGYMLEGLVPFKKTPANILRSGFEYSPFNAIKSIKETGKLIYENTGKRRGNLEDTYTAKNKLTGKERTVEKSLAADVLDSWSKTLTGTGLVALGYYLKNKGILNSSNKDEKWQDDLEGKQNYSITINGKTYTVDWAAPGIMPMLVGAEISKIKDRSNLLDQKVYENIDEIIGSVNAVLDPIFETSMMQGVKNTLETAANQTKYDDDGAIGGILGSMAANTLTGYATQGIPTLAGQIARTVDNTRRATDTASESPFISGAEKQGRKLMNKIPGLSQLNPAYRDAYGRTQNNSPFNNPLGNLAYQMMSPAYIQDINTTEPDKQAREAYYGVGEDGKPIMDKGVFPAWKSTVKANGHKLSPDEMSKYRESSGEANYDIRTALSKEEWFNSLDSTDQTEILKKANTVVNKIGLEANDYAQTGKDIEAYENGGIPALLDYWHNLNVNAQIKEATGLSASTNAAKEIAADLMKGNTALAQQKMDKAAQDKKNLDSLNAKYGTDMKMSDYIKYQEKGGAEEHIINQQKAIDYGFTQKDGSANTDSYNKAVEIVGNNDNALKAYSNYQKKGFEKDAQKVPYLMNDRTLTNEQKGKILRGTDPSKLGKAAKGMYDLGGYEGVYYYYLMKNLADTNQNGSVTKAERAALLNSNNQYVMQIPDDMYYYLGKNLK